MTSKEYAKLYPLVPITVFVLVFFLLMAANPPVPKAPEEPVCIVSGCSMQVCVPADSTIVTSCEWRDEYYCLQHTECKRIGGTCQWEQTPEYVACLAQYR